jgi:hypothetical protein
MNTTVSSSKSLPISDPIFDGHVRMMQHALTVCLEHASPILFTTNAVSEDLFAAYLSAFPEENRQHFNCHACKQFIESYGGLVAIDEQGNAFSPFWTIDASEFYLKPFGTLFEKVLAAKITGVFYSKKTLLGTPESGGWTHWAVNLPTSYTTLHPMTLTPGQATAAKLEDFKNVMRALDEFKPDDLALAVRILESEVLYQSEHLLGAAQWLAKVQDIRRNTKNHRTREALLWRSIALAPAGFCHPRAGMLGTLIVDIQGGLSFEEIKARFDDKMHPLNYQRPKVAPTAATIEQAEKKVAQLGIQNSLKRRFATLKDIIDNAIWLPKDSKKGENGSETSGENETKVFSHLKSKEQVNRTARPTPVLPAVIVTWEKFQRTVLPEADAIEFYTPHHNMPYTFHTTAVDQDAPPILQWDALEHRNPVAWYLYSFGSSAKDVGLVSGTYVKVTAIVFQPSMWGEKPLLHQGESVTFCLEGCHDVANRGGLGLFPVCMRSELHDVRDVIEAYSRAGKLEVPEGPLACGIRFQKEAEKTVKTRKVEDYETFRVTTKGQVSTYQLDRWD